MDINPRDYRAWYGLGQTYELLQMYFYAIYYYRKAATLRPFDARMWCALVRALPPSLPPSLPSSSTTIGRVPRMRCALVDFLFPPPSLPLSPPPSLLYSLCFFHVLSLPRYLSAYIILNHPLTNPSLPPSLPPSQGVCYEQLDRRAEAIKCYERAVCNNDR